MSLANIALRLVTDALAEAKAKTADEPKSLLIQPTDKKLLKNPEVKKWCEEVSELVLQQMENDFRN
jgi:hypothetical protein